MSPLRLVLVLSVLAGACRGIPAEEVPPGPEFRAGASMRDLTPPVGEGYETVWLAGFDPGRAATGVNDPIEARALVLEHGETRVALVAVDLIGLFLDEVEAARRRLADEHPEAEIDCLIVASTHNHEGPDTMGLWGPDRFRTGVASAYNERVVREIAAAAAEAASRLRPARLRFGQARAPELIRDTREPKVIDDRVLVLQAVAAAGGRAVATVVVFGCHPEATGARNTLITADYPGFTRRAIEQATGGTALFFSGAIGGLMTQLGLRMHDPDTGELAPRSSLRNTELYGIAVARRALEALETAEWNRTASLDAVLRPVDVPLTNIWYKSALSLGVLGGGAFLGDRIVDYGERGEWLLRTEVGVARIGDADLLLIPGEIYPELVVGGIPDPAESGVDFPEAPREPCLLELMRGSHRFVVGLANDELGYILPKRQWDLAPPHAYGRNEPQYGEINSVGPDAAPVLVNALQEILENR